MSIVIIVAFIFLALLAFFTFPPIGWKEVLFFIFIGIIGTILFLKIKGTEQ